jgi:hypothetical protein
VTALSPETVRRVAMLFQGAAREEAEKLLVEQCGNNLPLPRPFTPVELERFRFAALRLSGGQLDELRSALRLAAIDWSDLLMAADFGNDITAHTRWLPGGEPDASGDHRGQ